jgi:hypothetical protein
VKAIVYAAVTHWQSPNHDNAIANHLDAVTQSPNKAIAQSLNHPMQSRNRPINKSLNGAR